MNTLYPRQRALAFGREGALPLKLLLVFTLVAMLTLQPLLTSVDLPASVPALDLSKLPLSFVANVGQTDSAVQFQVHDMDGTVFFTDHEAVLSLPTATEPLHLRFEGVNSESTVIGGERLPGTVNYFIGDDPALWRTDVPTFAGVTYQDLYPGIALHYDGVSGRLKSTFIVSPGADPSLIRWRHDGATSVRLDRATGDLLVGLSGAALTERAPVAWQEIGGERVPVTVGYAIAADGSVGFSLGRYNPSLPLVIDPELTYGTYLGGSGFDEADGLALDDDGNIHVVGTTQSADFPTAGAIQDTAGGSEDAFVLKLNAAGDTLLYSTYLGGSDDDEGNGIAVTGDGLAYLTGDTQSSDFPLVAALQDTLRGTGDALVAKLSADGSALVYSTYLGGSNVDEGEGIALDSNDNAYIAGTTFSGDLFAGSLGGSVDAFVAKLSADGSALVYGDYLGGSGTESGEGIALDGENAILLGQTFSDDLPTVSPLQGYGGSGDLFVVKMNAAGDAALFSTYLGGSDSDYAYGLAADADGNAYVTGQTESADFPTTTGAFDTECGTDNKCNDDTGFYTFGDAFVAKLAADGSALLYSTYLGGSNVDKGYAIAVDADGNAYVTGDTFSADFPTEEPIQVFASPNGETSDAFVTKLNADGSGLVYSTYFGGSSSDYGTGVAVDGASAYVAGITFSIDLTTKDPLQAAHAGGDADLFVIKLEGDVSPPPPAEPNLAGSYKSASKSTIVSGETLTYTIHLRNSGGVDATADVVDQLPDEMTYVSGSADPAAVYDAGAGTLTWSDIDVPADGEVLLTFQATATTVDDPVVTTNVAAITWDGESIERQVSVMIVPDSPPPTPILIGSHKLPSKHVVVSDETLTYTIHLLNSGTADATADVVDELPAEMAYVDGSADPAAVYDAGTLTWSDVNVPAGDEVLLTFQATASTVTEPTPTVNIATISWDGESIERQAVVTIVPELLAGQDIALPTVDSLTIDDQDVLTDPNVTLHIEASDDEAVTQMFLEEWLLVTTPAPHWEMVKSSGWVPYATEYAWTLEEASGTHYVAAWVADAEGNKSSLNKNGLDFASLLLPGETVAQGGVVGYLVYFNADEDVTATLNTLSGDADLYVWFPGHHGLPNVYSNNPGTETDQVSFTTSTAGTYLFVVHGWEASTFDLGITPGGGPRAVTTAQGGLVTSADATASGGRTPLPKDPILTASGQDPLSETSTPKGPYTVFLPIIAR